MENIVNGLPLDAKERFEKISAGYIETDKFCSKHPKQPITIYPDGTKRCRACEREKRDQEFTEGRYSSLMAHRQNKKRGYLEQNSIVSNSMQLKKGIKNFIGRNQREKEVKHQAIECTKELADGQFLNVYLQGKPGSGKSHLSMAMLQNINQISKEGKKCLFINFPSLQQKIRASYNNDDQTFSEANMVQRMINADVLVLDDVASEINLTTRKGLVSDFSARILYAVMDARSEAKPTIITSNISWRDLKAMIDSRVYSRIGYGLRVISFDGIEDKRLNRGE